MWRDRSSRPLQAPSARSLSPLPTRRSASITSRRTFGRSPSTCTTRTQPIISFFGPRATTRPRSSAPPLTTGGGSRSSPRVNGGKLAQIGGIVYLDGDPSLHHFHAHKPDVWGL